MDLKLVHTIVVQTIPRFAEGQSGQGALSFEDMTSKVWGSILTELEWTCRPLTKDKDHGS